VLLLAGERIDALALSVQAAALAHIASALAPSATVLLYGCKVAAQTAGRRLIDHLEAALGVPVAAARGPVGSAALGGTWALHLADGRVPECLFSPSAQASYPGLLAIPTLTAGNDVPALTTGDDTITEDTVNALNAGDTIDGQDGADTLLISTIPTWWR
jgi:Ca2+-binding RTX toxin-like protein